MTKRIVLNSGKIQAAPVRVQARYMLDGEIVKTNSGTNIFEAGPNAMRNLQRNSYGANFVEVVDADTEQLYFSAKARLKNGKHHIESTYEWNPEDTERKYGASMLLKKAK